VDAPRGACGLQGTRCISPSDLNVVLVASVKPPFQTNWTRTPPEKTGCRKSLLLPKLVVEVDEELDAGFPRQAELVLVVVTVPFPKNEPFGFVLVPVYDVTVPAPVWVKVK
jgi:hypothetical protein